MMTEARGLPTAITLSAEPAAVARAASGIPARLEKAARGRASSVTTGSGDEFRRARESSRETETQTSSEEGEP
jgi:hypothetical protein